jgi:hypothetical protein
LEPPRRGKAGERAVASFTGATRRQKLPKRPVLVEIATDNGK